MVAPLFNVHTRFHYCHFEWNPIKLFEIAKNVQGSKCCLLTITILPFTIISGLIFFFLFFLTKRNEIAFFLLVSNSPHPSLPFFPDSIQSFILLLVKFSAFNVQSTLIIQGNGIEKKFKVKKYSNTYLNWEKIKCILFKPSFFNYFSTHKCALYMHVVQWRYVKYVAWKSIKRRTIFQIPNGERTIVTWFKFE